jgi:hypothetical protein
MTQNELYQYYAGQELRCKHWTLKEIKTYIKNEFPKQRVFEKTLRSLKRDAEMYQR